MSIPTWPETLPQNILAQGYKGGLPNNLLRQQMDIGPAKVRRRGTVAVEPVTGKILVTPTELAALITFYKTTLLDGALRFKWHGPLEDSMTRLEKTISGVTGIIETADRSAFVDPKSDISEYNGKRIDVLDTAGKIASGYIHHNAADESFVQMTYAAPGSSGIAVADNDNIDFGTGNFTLVWKGALPDWTPSDTAGAQILMTKHQGSADRWLLYINRTAYNYNIEFDARKTGGTSIEAISTKGALPVIDGATVEILAVITRETVDTAGSVAFYVNGVLWDTVTIPAGTPADLTNTGVLYISGTSAVRYASTTHHAYTFNRALSAAEVLSLYQNGIAEADKWGSQEKITPAANRDFSGANNWKNNNLSAFDNTDDLTVSSTARGQYCYLSNAYVGLPAGKKIRFSVTASGLSGAEFGVLIGGTNQYVIETLVEGRNVGEIVVTAGFHSTMTLLILSSGTGSITLDDFSVVQIGATLALEPEGIGVTDWQDSSTNNLDASYPATGYSVYPDGTGVRIASTANGSAYNFSSIEDGFSASGVHTIKIYDYLEMRFTEPPTWNWVDGYYEVTLPLEILP